jgi:hypothetical protein
VDINPKFDPNRVISESHLWIFSCDMDSFNWACQQPFTDASIALLQTIRNELLMYEGSNALYRTEMGFVFRGWTANAWTLGSPWVVVGS